MTDFILACTVAVSSFVYGVGSSLVADGRDNRKSRRHTRLAFVVLLFSLALVVFT